MRPLLLRIVLAGAVAMLIGCRQQLPEAETDAGRLYAQQCGQCHSAYNPHSMTAAMWAVEVPKMEDKMRQARLPALDAPQRQTIMEYLQRNAGTQ